MEGLCQAGAPSRDPVGTCILPPVSRHAREEHDLTRSSNLSDGPVRPARRLRRMRILPHDDRGCGWLAPLPPPPPARPLAGSERADYAVIGAGFTGLAIARRLAESRP